MQCSSAPAKEPHFLTGVTSERPPGDLWVTSTSQSLVTISSPPAAQHVGHHHDHDQHQQRHAHPDGNAVVRLVSSTDVSWKNNSSTSLIKNNKIQQQILLQVSCKNATTCQCQHSNSKENSNFLIKLECTSI